MITINNHVKLFLNLATVNAIISRRFDAGLGGLSLSDFMILYHLSQAPDGKMRRVDLAEKVGLTASGVTRLLAPMEKVGLVDRGEDAGDARVRFVMLAPGGRRRLEEAIERAELLSADLIPASQAKKVAALSQLLVELGGTAK